MTTKDVLDKRSTYASLNRRYDLLHHLWMSLPMHYERSKEVRKEMDALRPELENARLEYESALKKQKELARV